jgi:hypothetical protein
MRQSRVSLPLSTGWVDREHEVRIIGCVRTVRVLGWDWPSGRLSDVADRPLSSFAIESWRRGAGLLSMSFPRVRIDDVVTANAAGAA